MTAPGGAPDVTPAAAPAAPPEAAAAVILAAGASTRLGRPKQLVPHAGRTLLAHAAETALDAGFGRVVVVLGAHADLVRPALDGLRVEAVVCRHWALGLGASIARGVAAVADAPRAVLMLCDQPALTPAHLRTLAATPAPIACSAYGPVRGVPAAFDRAVFPELLALGEAGARAVIARDPARVAALPFPGGAIDVDVPADLARLTGMSPA